MWADILQTVSIIIAAVSVVLGVTAWRRSAIGQRRIELAEEALVLFYEAEEALRHIRSPAGFVGEGSSRKREEHETDEERQILDNAYVAIERYNSHSELFSKIRSLRYRFRAYFGEEAAEPFNELNRILNDIISAARRLSRYWMLHGRARMDEQQMKDHLARMNEAESIFWEGSSDPDPILPRIESAVRSINDTCQSIISPRRRFRL